MEDNKVKFLPFHAINEFMLADYRSSVMMSVMKSLDQLDAGRRRKIDQLIKKYVKVPGFRNSVKAPPVVKAKASIETFEKHPDFVSQILEAWSQINSSLRENTHKLLVSRNWEILPVDADRTKLPGFLPKWPSGEDFDKLTQAFSEMFPDFRIQDYDISLMVVWISGRLPYGQEDQDDSPDEK